MKDLINAQLEEATVKIYQNGINKLNALITKKTGEASEEAAQKKADSVINIDAETEALNSNTQAELLNAAAKNARGVGVSEDEINAIIEQTINEVNALQSAVEGLDIDFNGVVSGFDDTSKKVKDLNEQLDDLAKSEALSKLKYKFDNLEQPIEKCTNAISLLDKTLEGLSDDDYIGKIETTTRQLDLAKQKTSLLTDELCEIHKRKSGRDLQACKRTGA